MCFPGAETAAAVGLSAASSMASYGAKRAAYDSKVQQYEKNYQNALAVGRATDAANTERQMQESASYAQKDHLALVEGAQKAAQVRAAAASNGVRGATVGDLVNAIDTQVMEKRSTLETNWRGAVQNLQARKEGDVLETQMRIDNVAPPTAPSMWGDLFSFGGSVVKAAGSDDAKSLYRNVRSGLATDSM